MDEMIGCPIYPLLCCTYNNLEVGSHADPMCRYVVDLSNLREVGGQEWWWSVLS